MTDSLAATNFTGVLKYLTMFKKKRHIIRIATPGICFQIKNVYKLVAFDYHG